MDVMPSRTLFSNPEAWIALLLLLLDERHHVYTSPTAPVTLRKGDDKILACVASDVRQR